jgi:hypothetical protein
VNKKTSKFSVLSLAAFLVAMVALALAISAGGGEVPGERSYYQCDVYTEQGCAKYVVADGGEIEIRDGGILDLQAGASPTFNDTVTFSYASPSATVAEKAILISDADWDYAIDTGDVPIFSTAQVWMEDFLGDTLATEIVLLSGSDDVAVDPALSQGQYGLVVIVAGDSNANCAADCSEAALGLHWSADQGSLVFETKLHIDDITTVEMCVGMSDSIGLEMPATFTTDTPAAVADDFVGFCFDTDATTDEWWFCGIDGTTVATGVAVTGVAPANGAFQVLRVEIDAAGEAARGYIDGTLVGTLTANAVTVTDLLSPIAVVQSLTTAARTLTVDYIYVAAQRQ